MATKERSQNPNVGDDIVLRLFAYNSNARKNVSSVEQVDIYALDPTEITTENPDGRRLIQTIDGTSVLLVEEGQYSVTFNLPDLTYTIGNYLDVWTLEFEESEPVATVEQKWKIISDLWYTSPDPVLYDFSFGFRPNMIRNGSRRWLTIDIIPNVPTQSDLIRYYTNIAIASTLKISIEMACVKCMPKEQDLRLVVDKADVEFRKGCQAFYLLDTESLDMDCGIYNVEFEMEFGEAKFISDKHQLQIF